MRETKDDCALRLLREHGELKGLELVKLSGGRLKRGTVYVVLARLQDRGLVQYQKLYRLGEAVPRRLYSLVNPPDTVDANRWDAFVEGGQVLKGVRGLNFIDPTKVVAPPGFLKSHPVDEDDEVERTLEEEALHNLGIEDD